ncbi:MULTISPECIES: hypothetical protein [Bradyrhizobium]|uniref:Uncharacterized protein n=1 Tax=Bradyrhizobium barranii subsp. barranii TaxID=2823807 RepID=A0A7Z0QAA1_9BRAD|nr:MULTISPECIES: hypothetical protein [Bradyrhizobium]MBR0946461.1 hypothetical protein [Bradyrhizobium liaoningense]MBR0999345.1 hypothetical protein [Bradyrhizobium liaoningense]MCP1747093.1 hypothetical protein [Bradyrhizobium japonicum]MCP1865649.1 hypothetical protein [Bradyrhizobium japonicum]MCP1895580.1 hypothetical protein [Bradyrhizobium japonicum]
MKKIANLRDGVTNTKRMLTPKALRKPLRSRNRNDRRWMPARRIGAMAAYPDDAQDSVFPLLRRKLRVGISCG